MKPSQAEIEKAISEINAAERVRAAELRGNTRFGDWVKTFRRKYIVDGFLTPLYGNWDGRWGRVQSRVATFGDYILPDEMIGKAFSRGSRDWVRAEGWFWSYLMDGQELVSGGQIIPESIKIEGMPGVHVWQQMVLIAKEMSLYGEEGGGLFQFPNHLNEEFLAGVEKSREWAEDDDGYARPYETVRGLRWMQLFEEYQEAANSRDKLEWRPAWFHVANYALFNANIDKLPTFCAVFNSGGSLDVLRFLGKGFSVETTRLIGEMVFGISQNLSNPRDRSDFEREMRSMRWWLWTHIGHAERKKTLSYGNIAHLESIPRSTIQSAVEAFDDRLRNKLDRQMLGRFLVYAEKMGLGTNMVYCNLADKGLVPRRERGIDGFDDLFELIC